MTHDVTTARRNAEAWAAELGLYLCPDAAEVPAYVTAPVVRYDACVPRDHQLAAIAVECVRYVYGWDAATVDRVCSECDVSSDCVRLSLATDAEAYAAVAPPWPALVVARSR